MSGRRGGGGGGGGGGGRGGGRNYFKEMPREQQVSRALSRLLRHSAQQEGLELGKGGYAKLTDVVSLHCFFAGLVVSWSSGLALLYLIC